MNNQTKRLLQQKTIEAIKAPDSDRTLRPTSLLLLAGAIVEQDGVTSGNQQPGDVLQTQSLVDLSSMIVKRKGPTSGSDN